jgi:ornithine carbamoyltransferase
MKKDLLTINALTREDIEGLLQRSAWMKRARKDGVVHQPLLGRTLGMIFEKSSTRTRVSFEVGMYQLGGQALYLPGQDLQMGRGEPVSDTARTLSRYLDGIMIRTFSQNMVEEFARHASIPVVNGLTDLHHPCQALADLFTVMERRGRLAGLRLCYVGDGNNVAHSLIESCAKVGMHMALACPPGYEPDAAILRQAKQNAAAAGSELLLTSEPKKAAKGADVLYTDVWASMGQEQEQSQRVKAFAGYQIDANLLKEAAPEAIVMHCLPAHRGEEISAEVIEGPRSVVFDQAENRLHTQKAVLEMLMTR